jgi:hypothetical protein
MAVCMAAQWQKGAYWCEVISEGSMCVVSAAVCDSFNSLECAGEATSSENTSQ